jgi:branched-subunit amino acid transport protein
MIDKMNFWNVILFLGMGTLAIRVSFFFLLSKIKINPIIRKGFTYIPVAVLPALIGPSVVLHKGTIEFLYGHERLASLIVATLACFFSKSVLIAIITGLTSLYLFSTFLN